MKRNIVRCVMLCFATAFIFSQTSSTRQFLIPGHGELVLQVPEAWKFELLQPQDNLPPTITFSPISGKLFKVMVTAGGSADPEAQALDTGTMRMQVESTAKGAEGQSVEKFLKVQELAGPVISGFYFSATDKAPKTGEYPCMTQGVARMGEIVLAFTILTHTGQEAIVRTALEMLRGALPRRSNAVKMSTTKVKIPDQDWVIAFECPQLANMEEKYANGNYGFRANSGLFNLSLFVETPKGPGKGHKDCYDYYWALAKKNPAIAMDTVVAVQHADYFRVQYDTKEKFQGKPLRMRNVNYYIAYSGKWIDIHISVVEPTPADENIFTAFDSSLKVGK
jgi:hypothetical protein